jgi:IS5 family transposase
MSGMFDLHGRLLKIDSNGDFLVALDRLVPWESFRERLQVLRDKPRKSNAGARGYDPVMMFKVLVLQSMYNLSDAATEAQILDRLSFMRFLGITLADKVPDEKTIWTFRQQLGQHDLTEQLFADFDRYLRMTGFEARRGQIVDASIVPAPKQRNSREVNQAIKEGETPEDWSEPVRRQKDVDARWTQKHGKNHFGYKNHVQVDVEHKLIRSYAVTPANTHDSQVFGELLDADNTHPEVYADSAYHSGKSSEELAARGLRDHTQRKAHHHRKLTGQEQEMNRMRARIRCRVEHVFGMQVGRMGSAVLRGVGIVRAWAKIGLRNLSYNMSRYVRLVSQALGQPPGRHLMPAPGHPMGHVSGCPPHGRIPA